jgi:hypothetical protein
MSLHIVPPGKSKLIYYVQKIFENNGEYSNDDIEWIMTAFKKSYDDCVQNIYQFYMMLVLVNVKTFCGYFSQMYNFNLIRVVNERNHKEFIHFLINPKIHEITENSALTETEVKELMNILSLEILTANLTLKKLTVNENFCNQISKIYEESHKDLFTKFYSKKIDSARSSFEDFVVITEQNPKTKVTHAYTFKFMDILLKLISNEYPEYLSDITVLNLKEKYSTEIKLVEYSIAMLS